MKLILFMVLITALTIASCSQPSHNTQTLAATYGHTLNNNPAVDLGEMFDQVKQYGQFEGIVEGTVKEVCKQKGCWMTVAMPDGSDMRVTFKDYGFFVPTDSEGKKVKFGGEALYSTTSVKVLQHYAEDAGKSRDEIDAITSPEFSISFIAEGVEFF